MVDVVISQYCCDQLRMAGRRSRLWPSMAPVSEFQPFCSIGRRALEIVLNKKDKENKRLLSRAHHDPTTSLRTDLAPTKRERSDPAGKTTQRYCWDEIP